MKRNKQSVAGASVVLSVGDSPAAFDIVRSLAQEGHFAYVASSQPDDIAYYSKYCVGRIPLLPFSRENESKNLALLLEFASHCRTAPVLYYASDPELSFLWRNREALGAWFRFLLPPDLVLESLFNKVLFSSFAKSYLLPVPSTAIVKEAAELRALIPSLKFPCIVKPAFSEDWKWDTEEQGEFFGPYKKALHRINSQEELVSFCNALPQRQSGFLVQRYIDGRDENILSFHGYFDERSNCLGYFIGRKIRTYPPRTGGSTYIQTIEHPSLARLSIDALERIQFRGIVKIDYKWDPQESEFKILEINPRYNLWEVLGAFAGVNLITLALRHQLGLSVLPQKKYRTHVRLLYFKQDLRSFVTGYRLSGEWSTAEYIISLFRKTHFRVLDPKDIIPFFRSAYNFIAKSITRGYNETKNKTWEVYKERGPKTIVATNSIPLHDDMPH